MSPKKIMLLFTLLLPLLLLSGCARKLIIAEVLQQPVNAKIYTKCNIWYTNPEKISCVNYQSGKILPVGTEIKIVDATADEIIFTDAKGQEYRIKLDEELLMIPPAAYVRQIFTLKNLKELTAGIPKPVKEKIMRGIVTPKMTKRDVLLAYGHPPAFRTPSTLNSTWIYFVNRDTTKRVIFRGNEVKTILKFDAE